MLLHTINLCTFNNLSFLTCLFYTVKVLVHFIWSSSSKSLCWLFPFLLSLLTFVGSRFLLTTWTTQTKKSVWPLWVWKCVRGSLGLIWFVLKCFPACVRGLKASGSLNTSPTCQDQLHTFIWCHCALPSQTGKTKTDRDTMCLSTSLDVFYFHEWQWDYSVSSLCHSLLCQYFDRGCFVLFLLL